MANNFVWVNATTLNGTLWDNGTLSSVASINQTGSLSILGASYKYLYTSLINSGTISQNISGYTLFFNQSANINNTGIYEFQAGEIRNQVDSVGVFNNTGIFRKTSSGLAIVSVPFYNTGTVNVELGTLLLLGGGSSNGGIFNISTGRTLEIKSSSSLTNNTYFLDSNTQINGTGTLMVSSGFLELASDWAFPTTTINILRNAGIKSPGTITNPGSLTIQGNAYLYASLNNTGTIIQNLVVSNPSDRLALNQSANINNSGIYEFQAGEISNAPNSVGVFNNSGTFRKTNSSLGIVALPFYNTGTIESLMGTVSFYNSYTHNNANLILKGGNFNFINPLTINGGNIEGNGNINAAITNSGLINPRYASNTEFGRLTINGNYTETNNATINIQLGGNTAGTNFDQVDINGTATFDGTLNVSLLNNFTPTLGSTFDVLTYDSLSFLSNLNFTGLDINSTLQFLPQWFNNKLTLKVVDKANATNINVTTNQDVVNASDGLLSLREAVIEANQNGSDNTIILGAQTYNLSFSGGSDDNFAATGDLDILPRGGRLTIRGQGANQTFISTSNLANIFEIHSGATINFQDVTIITSVTLALSSASVTEDGTSNLVYTFTRAGDSSNALTVNYTVGGTATIGTDYTGIATAETTKTVTFAAGSSTATVIVDPTADTTVESDETVILTLVSGTGYTIGTTSEVTGTITNDDPFTGTPNADTLTGTNGADTLIGLAGNDTYTVNHVGDIVTEALNAGTDLVNAS
ncbi:MAG: beta strand repeat-containing protein, partial [Dolichospermum sp.]